MKDSYSQKTKFLQLPVRKSGDVLKSSVEMDKWQRLENIILGSVKGVRNCSYSEGDIEVFKTPEGKTNVVLTQKPESPAFEGMARGVYLMVSDSIMWKDIGSSPFVYLWIAPSVGGGYDKCYNYSKPTKTKEDSILIGVVDTKALTVDRMPPSKLVSNNLVKHMEDNKDPHGEELVQSLLSSDKIVTKQLIVTGDIVMPISKKINDIELKGEAGVIVPFDFVVNFASWCGLDVGVKNVWFGFFGVDARVISPNEVCVYSDCCNSKIRIMVW